MRKISKSKERREELQVARLTEAIETIREFRHELEAQNDPTSSLPNQLYHWHRIRSHYEVVKALANEAEQLSKHMSYDQLPTAFRQSRVNTRSVILEGVGRFTLSSRTTAKVADWDKAGLFLEANKRDDALKMMLPASTMNSIVGELLKTGVEPDRERDGIDAQTYAYTSFTK